MSTKKKRPLTINLLLASLMFQGLSGLAGGFGLMMDPSGNSVGLPGEWLQGSPFSTYFIPGLILFTILGIGPVIVFFWVRKQHNLAWYGSMFIGLALVIWIGVEILIVGYHPTPPLQLIYGLLGLIIIILALPASTRQYFKAG